MINNTMFYKIIKFCVVGGSGVFVDFAITYVCKEFIKLNKYISNSCGFIVAASTNYLLNRVWTFQSVNPAIMRQYLIFFGFSLIGLGLNNATIYVLHGKGKWNFYFSKLFAIGVVTFWNFFMNYFFNFK